MSSAKKTPANKPIMIQAPPLPERKHAHYFKASGFAEIDVYRVLTLFSIVDPCIAHAIKKLLVAGGRGAGKDIHVDIQEAIDSLARWQDMRKEEAPRG